MIPTFWLKFAAVGLALLVAGFGGWKFRDNSCDAAAMRVERDQARGERDSFKTQLDLLKAATENDQKAAADAATRAIQLEAASREFESKAGSGVCFNADTADRLRRLWRK